MILPTKGIPVHRALLPLAFQVVEAAGSTPVTVGQLYRRLLDYRDERSLPATVSFEWFVLSLDVLHALGLAEVHGQVIVVGAQHAEAA